MLIEKKYQGTIPKNKIMNEKVDSTSDTYSCEYINGLIADNEDYTLPVASETTLGGIKVGDNLTISEDGTLNALEGALYNTDIVNNLNTNDATKVLSAAMGIELKNLIRLERLNNVDLNTIKYHCLCGVNDNCTNWLGGYGYFICIPLSLGSNYAIQIAFTEGGTKKYRLCKNGTTWENWTDI